MKKRNYPDREIEIDESTHKAIPTLGQRLKDAAWAVVLGIVLVQVFWFWGAFRTGSIGSPTSVVMLMDNPLFLSFLGVCAFLGWFAGPSFHDWLNVKISDWKFW